jgi:Na+/H+-dicarboxylate symporter
LADDALSSKSSKLRTWLIVAGLVGGLLAGATLRRFQVNNEEAVAIAQLIGSLWLNALRITLAPLIFSLVVTGVASAASSHLGWQLGRRVSRFFLLLLLASAAMGAVTGAILLDLGPMAAIERAHEAAPVTVPHASEWLAGLIPPNIIAAAADGAIVPLVLFALALAIAAVRLGDRAKPVLVFFEASSEIMLAIVQWILSMAPIGVFMLAFSLSAETGPNTGAFIGWYVIVQIAVTLVLAALMYILAASTGLSFKEFAREAAPAQAIAASTRSSLAALPMMVEAAKRLGLPKRSAAVVLPLAVAAFRIAAPASIVIVTLALSKIAGVELGLVQFSLVVLMAVLNTLVIAGLPNQVTFFAAYAPPALAVGVPIEAIPLFLAIDAIPDIFYTISNVTADLAVTAAVDRENIGRAEEQSGTRLISD